MFWLVKLLAIPAIVFTVVCSAQGAGDAVEEALADRIEALSETPDAEVRGIELLGAHLLADFYVRRDLTPAWTRPEQIDELLEMLAGSAEDGLDPQDYLFEELIELRREVADDGSPFAVADLDILLTASLSRYGYHRAFGKVDHHRLDSNINFKREWREGEDPAESIQQAIDAPSLRDFLAAEFAAGPVYQRLQAVLTSYHDIAEAGGWGEVPTGPTLREGDVGARVAALRRRLAVTGDLPEGAASSESEFDAALAAGVQAFQQRHALDADGVVGPATLAAINVPVERRIDQLRLSLERLRWVQDEIVDEFVVVNIAGYRTFFVRNQQIEWVTRAMVGKTYRQTPVFRGDIRYLEMNPTWTIPPGILRNDVLPAIKRDPNYLTDRNISVIDRDGRKIEPSTVDWSRYSRGVPYTLRQEPGPNNALGTIKFIFPNEHFVFLHDTPSRYLFDRAARAFSSGCIRVEDPLKLAELLLDAPDEWNRRSLQAKIDGGVTERVYLDEPVAVLIVYLTASLEPDGQVRFMDDIYDRDAPLLEALNESPQLVLPGAD
jgi:murein L,D-transpeptidase YcbB/YkuD